MRLKCPRCGGNNTAHVSVPNQTNWIWYCFSCEKSFPEESEVGANAMGEIVYLETLERMFVFLQEVLGFGLTSVHLNGKTYDKLCETVYHSTATATFTYMVDRGLISAFNGMPVFINDTVPSDEAWFSREKSSNYPIGIVKIFKFKDFRIPPCYLTYDHELKKPEIESTPRRYRLIELE